MVDWRVQPFARASVQRLESLCLALLTIQGIFQVRTATLYSAAVQTVGTSLDEWSLWILWATTLAPAFVVAAVAFALWRKWPFAVNLVRA